MPDRSESEFACEVVRVRTVEFHPNADKLDVVTFDMKTGPTAYRVLDQRGKRKPGDLVVYLSVDALCPLDQERFVFLRDRSKGKSHHRLKAARLRGIYSEGLLVDAFVGASLGDDVADLWQIEKYEPPQKGSAFPPPGTGAKSTSRGWWNTPNLGGRFPVYKILSLKKAPFSFEEGEMVSVTEKIHGTNFRCGWVNGVWTVGSHEVVKHGDHRPWWRKALDWFAFKSKAKTNSFYGGTPLYEFVADRFRQRLFDHPDFVFYGEIFGHTPGGQKIQDLTYGTTSGMLGTTLGTSQTKARFFEVFDVKKREWLDPIATRVKFNSVGLDPVPFLWGGPYSQDKIRELAEGPTTIGDGGHVREGVVVRDEAGRLTAKWVGEGYRTRKEEE